MGYYNELNLSRTAEDAEQDRRDGLFAPTDVIFAYTRAQALADGVLIDVSATARQAGFRYPVAATAALWADIAAIPPESGQDLAGRLWDVVWMAALAVRFAASDRAAFELALPVAGCDETELYAVCAVCGPGDAGEPVITLMQPNED